MAKITNSDAKTVLEVRGLRTHFVLETSTVRAVEGVSLTLDRDRTLGLVGESGCGKSVTALSIMQLIQSPPGKIVEGQILFHRQNGPGTVVDIASLDPHGVRDARHPRWRDRDGLSGADDFTESPVYRGGTDRRIGTTAPKSQPQGSDESGLGDALQGPHRRSRTATERVPSSVEWRYAPAGDDRYGALLQPGSPDRGRADHRPRRDHPGPDPGSDA